MQSWQVELTKKCSEMNMEARSDKLGTIIFCPKLPEGEVKDQIISLIPEENRPKVTFIEGPKPTTMSQFKNFLLSTGVIRDVGYEPDSQKHHIKFSIIGNGNPESENVDWSGIPEMLSKDGYFESWEITYDGKPLLSYNRKVSLELQSNNFREEYISKDDLTDLSILLGTEMDFDKLLEKL